MEGRLRLDAATWGTMGVGLGYAIAAATTRPERLVVAVEGDSAFGFSGMECETIVRCLSCFTMCFRHSTLRDNLVIPTQCLQLALQISQVFVKVRCTQLPNAYYTHLNVQIFLPPCRIHWATDICRAHLSSCMGIWLQASDGSYEGTSCQS